MSSKSTVSAGKGKAAKGKQEKPKKPYADFPLFPHASGRWCKKIRGKQVYFGKWNDPDAALAKYLDEKDDLHAGRTPRVSRDGLTMRDLLNRFLTAKRHLVDTSELTHRTFADYHATCERLNDAFGPTRLVEDLASHDFEHLRAALSKTRGPVTLGNEIQRIRVVFKYADDAGLIDRAVRYEPTFKRPSKKVLRRAQQENGERMFEVRQIRKLLDVAPVQLRAMILLGINCGLGNNDCGSLLQKHIDLDAGWLDYPRPKTGIKRRCPLWKETVAAVRAAIDGRPAAKDDADADRVFLTRLGQPWTRDAIVSGDVGKAPKIAPQIDAIAQQFSKLLVDQGMNRRGLGFYALRHTFETIAGDSTDQVAVDHVMGHVDPSMAANYRHRIDDKRLKKVSEHVRKWLFPPEKKGGKKAKG